MARTRAHQPLANDQLEELFDHLDDRLRLEPCDQTLRLTTAFLERRGLNARAVTPWLNRRGGYCDCEVLMNVEPRWRGLR